MSPPSATQLGEEERMALDVPDISKNLFDLSGYCGIVTGAGQGIGLALSKGLAYSGCDLVLVDRNDEQLQRAAEEIRAIGRNVATVSTDVTAEDAPEQLVEAAKGLSGRIDVLINNAGIMGYTDMLTVTDDQWDDMYGVNLRAPMRIMRAVLQEMVEAQRGSIINIGSSWSSRASVFNQDGGGVDYCSAKAALQSLTRAAAQDVAPHGIRINAIAPGAVDTPMHAHHRDYLFEYEKYIPLGRMQVAEDLAGTAVFLASDASSYITGQTLHVNGGILMVD
jgi:3-oxoacyl-[acyl-carrier protein] reductase